MTTGLRRLLLRVFKFVLLPVALLLLGYLVVGPLVSDYLNREKPHVSPPEPPQPEQT